jgi:PEP-CTERM motif
MKVRKVGRVLGLCFGAALFSGAAEGAFIGWTVGPAYDGFSGFNAIQTNGTLVAAIDIASSGSLTVDPGGLNITFLAAGNPLGGFTFDGGDPGSTDANWNTIVNSADFCGCGTKLFPNFLSGLTIGNTYQIQLFANDSRGCCSARSQYYDDGLGNNSPIVVQGSFLSTMGVFTADASSQAINFNLVPGNPGDPNALVLSAYVLRDITSQSGVPEPSTALMVGLGLVAALWLIHRTRRSQRA